MEVIIFCITITTLAVFSMFGLGIVIGREAGRHERVDKGDSRRSDKCEHADRADRVVASMGVDRDSTPADQGEIPIRRDDRQNLGETGTEEMKEMLRILIQLIERIEML